MGKDPKNSAGDGMKDTEKRKTLWSSWKQVMLGNNENQGDSEKEPVKPKEDQPPFWWI
ncbi:hypothetical protein [Alteribacter natronophilus]|uniref:hypothetical protein n=1 Tax=Alteribacter natronophilus TaxID=2583810 RepID=UPI0014866714|nr:hypothetical protein [Alteribacter natronophilus]